jgi:hypothetical protein
LFANLSSVSSFDNANLTCLGNLGQNGMNRNDSICVKFPKVAKES